MQELQQLLPPGVLIFFVIALAIGMLIPSLCLKWVMNAAFREEVSFGLILAMFVLNGVISFLVMLWFMINYEAELSRSPEALLLLIAASYALLLVQFTAFVPNSELVPVAMWKWAVGLILQYVVLFLISFAISLLLTLLGISLHMTAASM